MVRQLRPTTSLLVQRSRQDDATTPPSAASASQKWRSDWSHYDLGANSAKVDLRLRLASESESQKSIGFGEIIGEKIGDILPGYRYSAGALRFAPCFMEELRSIEAKSRSALPTRQICSNGPVTHDARGRKPAGEHARPRSASAFFQWHLPIVRPS